MNQSNSTAPIRVLLVDDSLPVRQRIRSLIEESGPVEVVGEADTASRALALFGRHQPDAVVMDMNLADGAGCAVLTEIKRIRPACVVIMLTGFFTPEFRELCRKLGADHCFEKSMEFERVPEVLAKLHRAQSDPEILSDPKNP